MVVPPARHRKAPTRFLEGYEVGNDSKSFAREGLADIVPHAIDSVDALQDDLRWVVR